MYDKHLDMFVKVVERGSFNKAVEDFYHITPTAAMKQINCLERDLGFRLFERGAHGVHLTPAGERVYRGALRMMTLAQATLEEARPAVGSRCPVRMAASIMVSPGRIASWWYQIAGEHPGIALEMVQVRDERKTMNEMIEHLGRDFDALLSVEPMTWPGGYPLSRSRRCSHRQYAWQFS